MIGLDTIIRPDGTPVLIDINPRSTSGIHLLGPHLMPNQLLNGTPCGSPVPDGTTAWVPLAALLTSAPNGLLRSRHRTSQWIDIITKRDDILPAAGQILAAATLLMTAKQLSISMLAATTADMEWNGTDPHS